VVATGVALIRVGDQPAPDDQLALTRTSVAEPATTGVTSCRAQYEVTSTSAGRFTAVVTVTNTGSKPVNGWTLRWNYPGASVNTPAPRLGDGWNATVSSDASGGGIATSGEGSRLLPAGTSTTIGFVGTTSGSTPAAPAGFTLNGKACR
jgi:endoglucanase